MKKDIGYFAPEFECISTVYKFSEHESGEGYTLFVNNKKLLDVPNSDISYFLDTVQSNNVEKKVCDKSAKINELQKELIEITAKYEALMAAAKKADTYGYTNDLNALVRAAKKKESMK